MERDPISRVSKPTELESSIYLQKEVNITFFKRCEKPYMCTYLKYISCYLNAEILMESQGSSIGVLASGPKKMRQDVAAICSSELSRNLQFESISFSW